MDTQEFAANILDKKRFEAFIDAILAIVITFLVLEFKVPKIEDATTSDLRGELLSMFPLFMCYIGSFFAIVSVYLDYHLLFKHLKQISGPYAIINFFFLITVSILPFATGFAGEYFTNEFAIAFYCSCILLMNIAFSFVFFYAFSKKLVDDEYFNPYTSRATKIAFVGLLMEALSIPLCFINPLLSILLILCVMLMHLLKHII